MSHSHQPINVYFHEYAVWIFGNKYLLRILRFSFFANALMMFCLLYILIYIVDKIKLRVFLQHFQDAQEEVDLIPNIKGSESGIISRTQI